MTTKYLYSLKTDFHGNLNISQLHGEINAHPAIRPECLTISNFKDDVHVVFKYALNANEKNNLNDIVANYTVDTSPPKTNFITIDPKKEKTHAKVYSKFAAFKYGGSNALDKINYIDVLSYMENGADSYSVRILDITNGKVVAERTEMTNTDEEIVDLGLIMHTPVGEAIFELQAKIESDDKKWAYIDSINIYY